MKILIASWRCPKHPQAGGAEHVTHRVASGLILRGHEVTWFAAGGANLLAEEVIDGIQVIRRGSQLTVHAYFAVWLKVKELRFGYFDIIVDQINTIPFLAHKITSTPTVVFIHQLAREVWFSETRMPVSLLGYMMERVILQQYKNQRLITVSSSSLRSLRELGLRGEADVIPEAVDSPRNTSQAVSGSPKHVRLVMVCRLVKSKRVDHAIRTVAFLHRRGIPVSLDVIGSGHKRLALELKNLSINLGIDRHITFHGRVSVGERNAIVAASFACVATSVREGWGLSITEANILGVPGAVYPVPGLCDSTIDRQTGVISSDATPPSLADAIESLWRDDGLYLRCRAGALEFATELTWDRTVDAFESALASHIER